MFKNDINGSQGKREKYERERNESVELGVSVIMSSREIGVKSESKNSSKNDKIGWE